MPLYALLCDCCGAQQDIYRSVAKMDDDLPVCCDTAMRRRICLPMVAADISPYQAMGVDVATGKAPVIQGRAQHRAYLKRNGYIEVGNEPLKPPPSIRPPTGDFDVRRELTEAVREVLPKYTR
jgi:hypothetical protein